MLVSLFNLTVMGTLMHAVVLCCVMIQERSQVGTVGPVTGCGLDELGLNRGKGKRFFFSPKHPD